MFTIARRVPQLAKSCRQPIKRNIQSKPHWFRSDREWYAVNNKWELRFMYIGGGIGLTYGTLETIDSIQHSSNDVEKKNNLLWSIPYIPATTGTGVIYGAATTMCYPLMIPVTFGIGTAFTYYLGEKYGKTIAKMFN